MNHLISCHSFQAYALENRQRTLTLRTPTLCANLNGTITPTRLGSLSAIPSMMQRRIYARIQAGRRRYYVNLEELRIVQKTCGSIQVVLRGSGGSLKLGHWLLVQGNHRRHEWKWKCVHRILRASECSPCIKQVLYYCSLSSRIGFILKCDFSLRTSAGQLFRWDCFCCKVTSVLY